MALLHESVNFKKLDVRMIERNVARGVISQGDLDAAVSQLPDDAQNADWTSIDSLSNHPDEPEGNGQTSHQH